MMGVVFVLPAARAALLTDLLDDTEICFLGFRLGPKVAASVAPLRWFVSGHVALLRANSLSPRTIPVLKVTPQVISVSLPPHQALLYQKTQCDTVLRGAE